MSLELLGTLSLRLPFEIFNVTVTQTIEVLTGDVRRYRLTVQLGIGSLHGMVTAHVPWLLLGLPPHPVIRFRDDEFLLDFRLKVVQERGSIVLLRSDRSDFLLLRECRLVREMHIIIYIFYVAILNKITSSRVWCLPIPLVNHNAVVRPHQITPN